MINLFKKSIYAILIFGIFGFFSVQTYAMNGGNNIRILHSDDIRDESDWMEIGHRGEMSLILRIKPIKAPADPYVKVEPTKELINWWNNTKAQERLGRYCNDSPFFLSESEVRNYFCSSEEGKIKQSEIKRRLTISKANWVGYNSEHCLDTGLGYLRDSRKNGFFAHLFDQGIVLYQTCYSGQVSLRPALWVKSEIFEEKILNKIESQMKFLNKFPNQDNLIKVIKQKLYSKFKEDSYADSKNLQMLILDGGSPEYRESIAHGIFEIYKNSSFISRDFIVIDEKNYNTNDYGQGLLFFDTERMNAFLEANYNQDAKILANKLVGQNLMAIMNSNNCAIALGGTDESVNKFFEINPNLKEKFDEKNTVYLVKNKSSCVSVTNSTPENTPASSEPKRKTSIQECMRPLDSLVGMEEFKHFIKGLIVSEKQRKIDAKYDILRKKPNLHMIITGNPGTGKTTVVNMLGKIFFDSGLIEKENIVSVERADLVDNVVGGSEALTKRKLSQAKGGILFIDEAYALTDGNSGANDNDFGRRVVEGLLNPLTSDDCVIVLAGYPDKMEQFINFNPGLTRRFAPDHRIFLPDYTKEQLFEIFRNLCAKCGLRLEYGAEVILLKHFEVMKKVDNFGNAGYAERLFEKVMKNRDFYWQEVLGEDYDELTPEQIEERKLIKTDYIKNAICEFENGIKLNKQDIPDYIC